MKKTDEIGRELQEVAPTLSKLDKVNFHQVEEGYFQNSTDAIMAMVGGEELPAVLSQIKKQELYSAPAASYFASLSDSIIGRINSDEVSEELAYCAPHLQSLPKEEVKSLPSDYFASFPEIMTQMAAHEEAAHHSEIDHLTTRWAVIWDQVVGFFSRPVYALAVASCVGLVVCICLVADSRGMSDDDKIFAQMQQIPVSDLNNYLSRHRDEYDEHTILHNINETDFTLYFDKAEDALKHPSDQGKSASDQDNIDELID